MASRRKGFAIILVAALAGLLFLLGASLVAISQLQRAAANYDQRTRLARDHARAALEIAIAELQRAAGPDQALTFLADVERNAVAEDFRSPSAPTDSGVFQPFWMGVENGGTGTRWLVTHELSGSNPPSPYSQENEYIPLVGADSVSATDPNDQSLLEVRVPKETISVEDLQGFSDERAIGNYAYWVGDLGVKASYAMYDRTDRTDHGSYISAFRRNRLRQLRANHASFPTVDQNLGGSGNPDVSNQERIDRFVNDFQFRDRYGDASESERFLIGLEEENPNQTLPPREVSLYFHDFTPLSKGLLTNSEVGGFKRDLSKRSTLDSDYDSKYLPYANLAATGMPVFGDYDDTEFPMSPASADSPAVMPVLTQFNLNYSVYLKKTSDTTADLFLSFNATYELWNPFTSKLATQSLRFEVRQLPQLFLWWTSPVKEPFWPPLSNHEPLASVAFTTPSLLNGSSFWRPGQIAVVSGPLVREVFQPSDPNVHEDPIFTVSFGPGNANRGVYFLGSVDGSFPFDLGTTEANNLEIGYGFQKFDEIGIRANPVVDVYLDATNELLASYQVSHNFELADSSRTGVFDDAARWFGFSWEVGDSELPASANYNPLNNSLSAAALTNLIADAQSGTNLVADVQDSEFLILGYNESDIAAGAPNTSYDYPILQLPKQELVSVSQLSNAYSSDSDLVPIGAPGSPRNSLFDETFFSTIPQGSNNWSLGEPLPNSGYTAIPKAILEDLQLGEPAENLFVHGMFNVHSTSIEAWATLLRASPASRLPYWFDLFEGIEDAQAGGEGDGNDALDENLYLFFNYPQSAEDVLDLDFVPAADAANYGLPERRASMRNGMFALAEVQVRALAQAIVSRIRTRVQASGPFSSMQDFVDSGVLENAIADLADASLNPDWADPGSARQFSQVTLLNMLAPYLSVRSDTFLVRAYGDAVNPADPNEIWARAYCEAIVQRTHEIHDPQNPALGRKMQVVAFRWLAPSEI